MTVLAATVANLVFSAHPDLRVTLHRDGGIYVECVEWRTPRGWETMLHGNDGAEFATSVATANAATWTAAGNELRFTAQTEWWEARAVITLAADQPVLRRTQTYRLRKDCDASIHPGWRIAGADAVRYTFPLRAWEQPLAGLPALRSDVAWALPLPFHVWHRADRVVLYGVDRTTSPGTIDFQPPDLVRVYYPDRAAQEANSGPPAIPERAHFAAGATITMTELLGALALAPGQEPLLEAERLAADLLLGTARGAARPQRAVSLEGEALPSLEVDRGRPGPRLAGGSPSSAQGCRRGHAGGAARPATEPAVRGDGDLRRVADGIAGFYQHCQLWDPDAFGPGQGWFRNMWVFTQRGTPAKSGHMSGYYDLGWGEGIAAEFVTGAVRHWRRTGATNLLRYVDEMTCGLERFKRDAAPDAPYCDRSEGKRFGDFMMDHAPGRRVWSHSLGHIGSQLLTAYEDAPDYPRPEIRGRWLAAARGIGLFFANRQRPDGDINDIYDEQEGEVNRKPHRIAARAVVCGLWARLARVTGEPRWLDHATRLAAAVAPEIGRYEFYNQMIDGLAAPATEFTDGESAYYVLEGLVPLFEQTKDPRVLRSCQQAAAFGIAWTYFYDLPEAHGGVARGGQSCRMPDYPLLYPIGPAKAVEPLVRLSHASGDGFYERMAGEMVAFIAAYQWDCPSKPWHGGMIHAIEQWSGRHWGPDKAGQVDTGMATGNSLAALEFWLDHHAQPNQ